ncbi:MAG: RluA family pseudouridine synthase [Chloroflexota bacterium]|nr:RluA family pseudouridine synthase [Chloroflexota bacterium]PLS78355.1 MAG: RluA family pseudouridine synthase [Chloroflexota bacterium]
MSDPAPRIQPKIQQIVAAEQAGYSLQHLVAVAADISAEAAYELIARGAVWLDRRRAQQANIALQPGSQIQVHFPPTGTYATVSIGQTDILWEDDSLLALNKQPGWHVNYTPWDMWGTVPWALAAFLRDRDGVDVPLHLAHQLDRDTSGVLLISKNPAINAGLQQLFLQGSIAKHYIALASGGVEQTTLEVATGHGRGRNGLFRVYPLAEVGRVLPFGTQRVRAMRTRFTVIARHEAASLLQAEPVTGRTHQIRLHLAHIGHPLVGDARYGGPGEIRGYRATHHLLHAARLTFTHPLTLHPLTLTAPLPRSWREALDRLGLPEPGQD